MFFVQKKIRPLRGADRMGLWYLRKNGQLRGGDLVWPLGAVL